MIRIAVADTSAGPIEYAEEGSGHAILLLHGESSNCRERLVHPPLANAGFRLIVPSRPGHGRTPLSVGRSAADAADAMAGLLASLGISRAIVAAVSSAGPTAVALAARNPDLVSGLVLESAVTCPASSPWGRPSSHRRFYTGCHQLRWKLLGLAARLAPRLVAVRMLAVTSSHDTLDIRARLRRSDLEAVRRFFSSGSSAAGALADWDHDVPEAHLAAVRVPTLIVHSRDDRSVPFAGAERAHALIPGSQLIAPATGGHFLWIGPGAEEITQRVIAFLKAL
ncbi:MAG: alpha/beta hydrolase [Spirochaetes bacterium]|nr:alpha/beta hydrolase [Spirochaetota bacterium]